MRTEKTRVKLYRINWKEIGWAVFISAVVVVALVDVVGLPLPVGVIAGIVAAALYVWLDDAIKPIEFDVETTYDDDTAEKVEAEEDKPAPEAPKPGLMRKAATLAGEIALAAAKRKADEMLNGRAKKS